MSEIENTHIYCQYERDMVKVWAILLLRFLGIVRMNNKKAKKALNRIYLSDHVPYKERENTKNYASFIITADPIGFAIVNEYNKVFLTRKLYFLFVAVYFVFYFSFILVAPFFYQETEVNYFFNFANSITFGLSTFVYKLIWYWQLIFNLVCWLISAVCFSILSGYIPTDDYGLKKELESYVIDMYKRGEITKERAMMLARHKDKPYKNKSGVDNKNAQERKISRDVFIVHGHDEQMKQETARAIEKLGLNAIILHEKSSLGKTIIEKLEHYSDAAFAIILMSPDDLGCSSKVNLGFSFNANKKMNGRARQNVIFEHGYLAAKLGRNRVCALVKGNVEVPSDLNGIVYVAYDDAGAWKIEVSKEMQSVGLEPNIDSLM